MDVEEHINKAIARVKKIGITPSVSILKKTDKVQVTEQRNFVIVTIIRGKKVFTGASKRVPSDIYDKDVGIAIASKEAILSGFEKRDEYEIQKMENAQDESMVKIPYALLDEMHKIVSGYVHNRVYKKMKAAEIDGKALRVLSNHRETFAKKYHKGAYIGDKV